MISKRHDNLESNLDLVALLTTEGTSPNSYDIEVDSTILCSFVGFLVNSIVPWGRKRRRVESGSKLKFSISNLVEVAGGNILTNQQILRGDKKRREKGDEVSKRNVKVLWW